MSRYDDFQETIDEALYLVAAAEAEDEAAAHDYLQSFPGELRAMGSLPQVRAQIQREETDAQNDELSTTWRNVSRRCARLARARLVDLEREQRAAEEAKRRREEEARRARQQAVDANARREQEARLARIKREADEAERRKAAALAVARQKERDAVTAERAALAAERDALAAQRRRGSVDRESPSRSSRAEPGRAPADRTPPTPQRTRPTRSELFDPPAPRPRAAGTVVEPRAAAPETPPPAAAKALIGETLTEYRVTRGLTVTLAAHLLGVDREEINRAEAAPAQALTGAVLVAFRELRDREAMMDHLLPPEAPPVQVVEQSEAASAKPLATAPPSSSRSRGAPLSGRDLHAWRTGKGLNQAAAAKRLGVSQGYVAKAESGGAKPLGPALQKALGKCIAA